MLLDSRCNIRPIFRPTDILSRLGTCLIIFYFIDSLYSGRVGMGTGGSGMFRMSVVIDQNVKDELHFFLSHFAVAIFVLSAFQEMSHSGSHPSHLKQKISIVKSLTAPCSGGLQDCDRCTQYSAKYGSIVHANNV